MIRKSTSYALAVLIACGTGAVASDFDGAALAPHAESLGMVQPADGWGIGGWWKGPVQKKMAETMARGGGGTPSVGPLQCLYIRIRFPDDMGDPISDVGAHNLMEQVDSWYNEASYGALRISTTVTPILTMPYPRRYYDTDAPVEWPNDIDGIGELTLDADRLAKAAGYDPAHYGLVSIRLSPLNAYGFGGLGGGGRTWYRADSLTVYIHEIGHAIGLPHANAWETQGWSSINATTAIPTWRASGDTGYKYVRENIEYGDPWDNMGSGGLGHFNVIFKSALGWITPDHILDVPESAKFRIAAFDAPRLEPGAIAAARVPRISTPGQSGIQTLWLGYRHRVASPFGNNMRFRQFDDRGYAVNGLQVHMDASDLIIQQRGNGGLHLPNEALIDATPGTPVDIQGEGAESETGAANNPSKGDGQIHVGRTWSDPASDLHITVVNRVDSDPDALDVVVNRGTQGANRPPKLTIQPITNGDTWTPGDILQVAYPYNPTTKKAGDQSETVRFKATAIDPDGDELAYYWEFGDFRFASKNADQISYAWPKASVPLIALTAQNQLDFSTTKDGPRGHLFTVRCFVSDMKGGVSVAEVPVNVGMPRQPSFDDADVENGRYRVNVGGRILDQDGKPMPGVQVSLMGRASAGAEYTTLGNWLAYTDNDGRYVISGVIPGGYVVLPRKEGYNFAGTDGAVDMKDSVTFATTLAVAPGKDIKDFNFVAVKRQWVYVEAIRSTPDGRALRWQDLNGNGEMDADEVRPEKWTDGKMNPVCANGVVDRDEIEVEPAFPNGELGQTIPLSEIVRPAAGGSTAFIMRIRREGPVPHAPVDSKDYAYLNERAGEVFTDQDLVVRLYQDATGGIDTAVNGSDYTFSTTFLDKIYELPTKTIGTNQPDHIEWATLTLTNESDLPYFDDKTLVDPPTPDIVRVVNPEFNSQKRSNESHPATVEPPGAATGLGADRYVVIRGTKDPINVPYSVAPNSWIHKGSVGQGVEWTDIVINVNGSDTINQPRVMSLFAGYSPDYYVAKAYAAVSINPATGLSQPQPSVAVSAANASENGSQDGSIVFARSGRIDLDVVVTYRIGSANDAALLGTDYQVLAELTATGTPGVMDGQITIPAGQRSARVAYYAMYDGFREQLERFTVLIRDVQGGGIGSPSSALGGILDNDLPAVWVVNTAMARESVRAKDAAQRVAGDPQNGRFAIMRAGDLGMSLAVKVAFEGTATFATDYDAQYTTTIQGTTQTVKLATKEESTVIVPAGFSSVFVDIVPKADTVREGNETVRMSILSDSVYNAVNPAIADTMLLDAALSDVTLTVNNGRTLGTSEGQKPDVVFSRYRGDFTKALGIDYLVTGTADYGYDFNLTGTKGRAVIPANATSVQVIVDIQADTARETDEAICLLLLPSAEYNIDPSANNVVITIASNSGNGKQAYTFKFDKTSLKVAEGDAAYDLVGKTGGSPFFVDVVLSDKPDGACTFDPNDTTRSDKLINSQIWVDWEVVSTANPKDNAVGDADFILAHGTMIFATEQDMKKGNPYWFDSGRGANSPPIDPYVNTPGHPRYGQPYNTVSYWERIGPGRYYRRSLWFAVSGDIDTERDDLTGLTGNETFQVRLAERATGQPRPALASSDDLYKNADGTSNERLGEKWAFKPSKLAGVQAEDLTICTVTIVDDDGSKITVETDPMTTSIAEGSAGKFVFKRTVVHDGRDVATPDDVKVYFELAGTAAEGVDYSVSGATPIRVAFSDGMYSGDGGMIYCVEFKGDVRNATTNALITPGETEKIVQILAKSSGAAEDNVPEFTESVWVRLINPNVILAARSCGNLTTLIPSGRSHAQVPDDSGYSAPTLYPDFDGIASWNPWIPKLTMPTGTRIPDGSAVMYITDGTSSAADPAESGAMPLVDIAAVKALASEPKRGLGDLIYRFTRNGGSPGPLSVLYQYNRQSTATTMALKDAANRTIPGSIDADMLVTGSVTIPAGASSVDLPIAVLDDTAVEGTEMLIVGLVASSSYRVGSNGAAIGYILDDDIDPAIVSVHAEAGTIVENQTDPGVFTLVRNGDFKLPLVCYIEIAGSAVRDADYGVETDALIEPADLPGYVSRNGSAAFKLTFPVDAPTAQVRVRQIEDAETEGDESARLTILDSGDPVAPAYIPDLTQNIATIVIVDDELPSVYVEGLREAREASARSAQFRFVRSGGASGAISIQYGVAGDVDSSDYVGMSGSIILAPGDVAQTIDIVPIDDDALEADEALTVNVLSGSGYVAGGAGGNASATVKLIDNDRSRVSIAATIGDAAESPQADGLFTISRTASAAGLAQSIDVKYAISGAAAQDEDYARIIPVGTVQGMVNMPAGASSVGIPVTVIDDDLVEEPEMVTMTLADGPGYQLDLDPANLTATVTITSEDRYQVDIRAEPGYTLFSGCNKPAKFILRRSGGLTGRLRVQFTYDATANSTVPAGILALKGQHYSIGEPAGTDLYVIMEEGVQEASIDITPLAVGYREVWLKVTAPGDQSYVPKLGQEAARIGILTGNEAIVSLDASDAQADEPTQSSAAGSASLTLVRTASVEAPITQFLDVNLQWSGTGGSADVQSVSVGSQTYLSLPSSVRFPADENTMAITIVPAGDDLVEGAETIIGRVIDSTQQDANGKPLYYPACSVSSTIAISDNPPPKARIVSEPILYAIAGSEFTYTVLTRTPPDAPASLPAPKFSLINSQNDLNAPSGMQIDANTGVLSWTVPSSGIGHVRARVRVENVTNNVDYQDIIIVILPASIVPN